tara:strand:- start:1865 stop:2263 length:399 start_codon:yes stop_codon:yes gene_type:complete
MIGPFLDYTSVDYTITGSGGVIYTTTYPAFISIEVISSSGDPFADYPSANTIPNAGIRTGVGSGSTQYLATQIWQHSISTIVDGNNSPTGTDVELYCPGGVVSSGRGISENVVCVSGTIAIKLHIFRLPTSP